MKGDLLEVGWFAWDVGCGLCAGLQWRNLELRSRALWMRMGCAV